MDKYMKSKNTQKIYLSIDFLIFISLISRNINVKLGKNLIFLKKGKTIISVGNWKFSRSRKTKRTSPLNLSQKI